MPVASTLHTDEHGPCIPALVEPYTVLVVLNTVANHFLAWSLFRFWGWWDEGSMFSGANPVPETSDLLSDPNWFRLCTSPGFLRWCARSYRMSESQLEWRPTKFSQIFMLTVGGIFGGSNPPSMSHFS